MQSIIDKVTPKTGNVVKLMDTFQSEAEGGAGIALPFPILNKLLGNGLKKGYTSFIAGPAGNGKTFWVYRVLQSLLKSSTAFKYIPLEYDAAEHLRRITAVKAKSWGMVDSDKEHAEARMGVFLNNPSWRKDFEKMEQHICENPSALEVINGCPDIPEVPYEAVVEVLTHFAKDNEIIIIDPITAIDHDHKNGNEWDQQKRFIRKVGAIAKYYNCHIMMVSHTGKRQKVRGVETKLTMDDMAGSAAFSRFSQYMMLLDFHDEKTSTVKKRGGVNADIGHHRTMFIAKATFGPGKGQRIAYDFIEGPEMGELGWIVND